MICRHCDTEIDTRIREADGSVICPGCGAVYRPKSTPRPETRPATASEYEPPRPRATISQRNGNQPHKKGKGSNIGLKVTIAILSTVLVIGGGAATILHLRTNEKSGPQDSQMHTTTLTVPAVEGTQVLTSFVECPTNYLWGGAVTHSDNGYSYFVLYDHSDLNQTVNICRISDFGDTPEIIYSESATGGIDIKSDDFHGYFVRIGCLTAYKDSLYFIREYENHDASLLRISENGGGLTTILENTRLYPQYTWRNGNYLFVANNKIDLETGEASPTFDMVAKTIGENKRIAIYGISEGFIYYAYLDENYSSLLSGLYRIAVSGGNAEPIEAIGKERLNNVGHHLLGAFSSYTFILDNALWSCDTNDDNAIILERTDFSTGKVTTVLSSGIGATGFAASPDGVYYFDNNGNLWRCNLYGNSPSLLISSEPGDEYLRVIPMLSGDWIYYTYYDTGEGWSRVNLEAKSFPDNQLMGDDWDLSPTWYT